MCTVLGYGKGVEDAGGVSGVLGFCCVLWRFFGIMRSLLCLFVYLGGCVLSVTLKPFFFSIQRRRHTANPEFVLNLAVVYPVYCFYVKQLCPRTTDSQHNQGPR